MVESKELEINLLSLNLMQETSLVWSISQVNI